MYKTLINDMEVVAYNIYTVIVTKGGTNQIVSLKPIDVRKCRSCDKPATHTIYWDNVPHRSPDSPRPSFNYCLGCGKEEITKYYKNDRIYGGRNDA